MTVLSDELISSLDSILVNDYDSEIEDISESYDECWRCGGSCEGTCEDCCIGSCDLTE